MAAIDMCAGMRFSVSMPDWGCELLAVSLTTCLAVADQPLTVANTVQPVLDRETVGIGLPPLGSVSYDPSQKYNGRFIFISPTGTEYAVLVTCTSTLAGG